jgi:hypothetical protein
MPKYVAAITMVPKDLFSWHLSWSETQLYNQLPGKLFAKVDIVPSEAYTGERDKRLDLENAEVAEHLKNPFSDRYTGPVIVHEGEAGSHLDYRLHIEGAMKRAGFYPNSWKFERFRRDFKGRSLMQTRCWINDDDEIKEADMTEMLRKVDTELAA